jgi:renal tumor antigen
MHKYRLLGKKGEGTFSEVLKAQDIKSNKLVAIKCMKNHFDSVEQVNRLREIQALRRLSPHANIIKLYEVLYDRSTGRLALVFELMEMNIYELIRGRRQYLAEDKVLHYMYQLMKGIDHMHRNGIFHRDIKPENILILNDALKLADFGSCRGIYSKQPFTEYISTRWYRAPECLLTDGYYNYKMDIWGVGCVFFEIMSLYPLFPGNNELDQIHKIHNIMGTPPTELLNRLKKFGTHMDFDFPVKQGTGITKLLPHASPEALDLMTKLLTYNPEERPSAKQALKHPYFKEIREIDRKLRKQKAGTVADEDDEDGQPQSNNSTTNRTGQQDEEDSQRLPPLPVGGSTLPVLTQTNKSVPAEVKTNATTGAIPSKSGSLPKGKEETKTLPKLVPLKR